MKLKGHNSKTRVNEINVVYQWFIAMWLSDLL